MFRLRASFALAITLGVAAPLVLTGCGSSNAASPTTSAAASSASAEPSSASASAAPSETAVVVTVNGFDVTADPALTAMLPEQFKGGLRIVTSAPYPPFEIFDENQQLAGLDIDLGNMIAAKLGIKATWESIDYNGVIPAIQAGKYDMVLASIGDTPEREKAIDFVNYSKQGQILLVVAGNPEGITGLESMCGKTLAVEAGNVTPEYFAPLQKKCAADGKPEMTVKELPKTSDALLAVKSGGAAAQYLGVATAADLMSSAEGKGYEIVTPAGKPFGYIPRYVGAGLPKNQPELRGAVQAALEALLADGTLKDLYTKYGQEQILTDKITVNTVEDIPLL